MKKLSSILVAAMLFIACTPQQQVVSQPTTPKPQAQESEIEQQIRETKKQIELQKAQYELELLQIQQEQAKAKLREQATLEAGAKNSLFLV